LPQDKEISGANGPQNLSEDLVADLKIGHYMDLEKLKSTARNRCATRTRKGRFLTPFKERTG